MSPSVSASPTPYHPAHRLAPVLGLLAGGLWLAPAALAQNQPGPVVCTTSLEAPPAGSGSVRGRALAPVEVTRCGPVLSTGQVVEQRFFSWTAPFERGVDMSHQITDLFGIAMGGGDGTKVMGFGFPDQTIVWDGAAVNSLYNRLLDGQSLAMPVRTPDLGNPFRSSLVMAPYAPRPLDVQPEPLMGGGAAKPVSGGRVRGLW